MIQFGWTKQSLKPGDRVTVTVVPGKNGKPIGRIVELVFSNGRKLVGRATGDPESSKPEEYSKP